MTGILTATHSDAATPCDSGNATGQESRASWQPGITKQWAQFDQVAADAQRALNRERLRHRLQVLCELEDGWAGDGEGVSLDRDLLAFVEDVVADLAIPYLYATPEGGISAEWDGTEGRRASAYFEPDGGVQIRRRGGAEGRQSLTLSPTPEPLSVRSLIENYHACITE